MKKWLSEGKQSKITKEIKKISSSFSGSDFNKVKNILTWMKKNISRTQDQNKVMKIFATRTADKVIKDNFSTGCHDDALVFSTLCRAANIPAKFLQGISKLDPKNAGHCAIEVFIDNNWVLVDQSKDVIYLDLKRSQFYQWHYIVAEGIDSWDIGIDTFESWKKSSDKVTRHLEKL